MHDDRLRLIFTCCHPALSPEAQVALTLRLLGGLSTERSPDRSSWPNRRWRSAWCVPSARSRPPESLTACRQITSCPIACRPVLAVVYLIYNAGLTSPAEPGLCVEAIRLARILATLMPDEPEVAGLLALLLLTESRRASRTRPDGSLVLLAEQDRTPLGSGLDRGGPGDRTPVPPSQPARPLPAAGRDQRRACRRRDVRADRLVADRRPVRPAARARPDAGRGPQPRHRHRRGRTARCRAGAGRRAGPRQLLPLPRHAGRSASARLARDSEAAQPTSAPPSWRRRTPNGTSSGTGAEPRGDRRPVLR